eukprot:CAMPEP_0116868666 /NCGR_PEP_ID=MMETSP0418-20121206/27325_1 /TAXON_ID=1158023 /ORGANISM="Astrosyne radiata, Strain 13vi08-1A" /LENGTH=64 /DNA_ID=CAMNT_0004504665 /DNA_START=865 /DNA_END=1056 /DNA_ORIENTATION=+
MTFGIPSKKKWLSVKKSSPVSMNKTPTKTKHFVRGTGFSTSVMPNICVLRSRHASEKEEQDPVW